MPDDVQPKAQVLAPEKKPDLVAGASITPIVPRTIEEVFRVAQAVIKAGLAPDSYTKERGQDLPMDQVISRVVIGIMKGAEVGFPPITALSTIAIINGRPCIYGDGAVALIQSKGVLEKMTIEDIGEAPGDETETAKFSPGYGRRVTMWRRGQKEPYVGEFTVGDAKRAHLWMDGRRKPWIEHPKRMLKWRAFGQPASDGFADCLMGLWIREIVEDLPPATTQTTDASFLDDARPVQAQLAAPAEAPMPMAPIETKQPEPMPVEKPATIAETPAAKAEPPKAPPKPLEVPTLDGRNRKLPNWTEFEKVARAALETETDIDGFLKANERSLKHMQLANPAGYEAITTIIERRKQAPGPIGSD